jgi:energy-converting hydrogenase Eha subunit A
VLLLVWFLPQASSIKAGAAMRKVISAVLASSMLAAGIHLLIQELFGDSAITAHMLAFGGLLTTGGAAWLWSDMTATQARRPRLSPDGDGNPMRKR